VSWGAEEVADIHAAFVEDLPIRYTGAGLVDAPVSAVRSDTAASEFQGAGSTLRQISFEILQADLPGVPAKGDTLVEDDGDGARWRVNEKRRRDDVGAWELIVEGVPA
jgi:hypothetical protein